MNTLVVPQQLRDRQALASDPVTSIWVSANAGSGKTHVLTQRVIRLLLSGVPPAKILCLTFTKAAAAQMATRVFDTLSRWTSLDDAALRAAILATGAPTPTAADLVRARRLFTRTVETPGGLKIQTIHAFCERLLHLFPFEANVAARFEVADEKRAEELMSRAKVVTIEAARDRPGRLQESLRLVAEVAGPLRIHALMADAQRRRSRVERYPEDLQETLAGRLGGDGAAAADVRQAMVENGLSPDEWAALAGRLEDGTAQDKRYAAHLRATRAAYASEAVVARFEATLAAYLKVFFDGNDRPRPKLVTKGLAERDPELDARLVAERDRLVVLREKLRIAEAVERTRALVDLVDATRRIYEQMKTAAGLLDFEDLIERTSCLLRRSEAGWVLHKLDAGIDHVLVDEAQDTSEAQWQILESLTGDFAAGHGGREDNRSFFVVGDDKQSIFSFQGAAPLMFDQMRGAFERRFRDGGRPFERVSLKSSFRSVPGILATVDKVFEPAANQDGLVAGDVWPTHESIKASLPGLVEVWPPVARTEPPQPEEWTIPLDMPSEGEPANIVADRVARMIKALTAKDADEYVHEGSGRRPIRPGDILVLVRTRNAVFEAVIRALKRHYVPVAGADRLDVAHHIAVMDLVAAGRASLLPEDDLSLAALLKSPLFGFTDDDLIKIAPERPGALIEALAASDLDHHRAAHAKVRSWQSRAAGAAPFAFYAELLGRDGGRLQMETRLGPEAHDAIDEFLRLALAHEQEAAPSLVTFLDDIEALESSIRRDMEEAGDAVRVMTVHASKGLEAKIVVLPDTCQVPDTRLDPTVFDLNKESGLAPVLVWSPHKSDDPPAVAKARADERLATMREYRRLLYVALTRAEERLYIAGFHKTKEPSLDCWGRMIESALADAVEVPAFWDTAETVRRIVSPGRVAPLTAGSMSSEQHHLGLTPGWLRQSVEPAAAPAPLRPSRPTGAASAERRRRLAYGSAVHLLLQHLPGQPEGRREATGRAVLDAQIASGLDPADVEAALDEALAVLAIPALAPLFGPQARAEVAVTGSVAGETTGPTRTVVGTVDRLVVEQGRVLLADFKTGVPDPASEADHRRQLALYREVLASVWPDRPIVTWLVWTHERRIVEIG